MVLRSDCRKEKTTSLNKAKPIIKWEGKSIMKLVWKSVISAPKAKLCKKKI